MTVFFFNLAQSAARRNAGGPSSYHGVHPRRTGQFAWRKHGIFKRLTLMIEWEADKFEPNWNGDKGYWRRVNWWEPAQPSDFEVIEVRPGI